MENLSLYTQINSLPQNLKKEVRDFVEFLKSKNKSTKRKNRTGFGVLKGKIQLADDFDEPLDEFKDYM